MVLSLPAYIIYKVTKGANTIGTRPALIIRSKLYYCQQHYEIAL